MELSKRDKKIARQIIEKGLQKEYVQGLSEIDSILNDWKNTKRDNRESYQLLYRKLINIDKNIARRYNNMSGSKYFLIIVGQLLDEIITESDLDELSDESRQKVMLYIKITREHQ